MVLKSKFLNSSLKVFSHHFDGKIQLNLNL